jgi:hypothetical protein
MLDRNKFHEQPRIEVSEVPITIKLFMGGWSLLMIKQSQKEVVPVSHELRNAAKKRHVERKNTQLAYYLKINS